MSQVDARFLFGLPCPLPPVAWWENCVQLFSIHGRYRTNVRHLGVPLVVDCIWCILLPRFPSQSLCSHHDVWPLWQVSPAFRPYHSPFSQVVIINGSDKLIKLPFASGPTSNSSIMEKYPFTTKRELEKLYRNYPSLYRLFSVRPFLTSIVTRLWLNCPFASGAPSNSPIMEKYQFTTKRKLENIIP